MTGLLQGRGAIITGASQGLGLEIARKYVREGASVAFCARSPHAVQAALEELRTLASDGQVVHGATADVAEASGIQAFIEGAIEALGHVHVLVNNAGVYGPMGTIDEVDWKAWADAIAINLHGSVLACRAMLPHFRSHGYGKIVQLSGGGATAPLPRISAYAASKAAIVRFAETLAEELRGTGIEVNSIAPGALNTRLLDEVLEAGPERVGAGFYARSLKQKETGGAPLDAGARLAVFLASAESDGITGKLFSAIWDPWQRLPEYREQLANSDVYTLRRIVPEDRGLSFS
jgi:NAD(P)-dependent dehydrogenase (short-subunit alcohol dehydrogenase family)